MPQSSHAENLTGDFIAELEAFAQKITGLPKMAPIRSGGYIPSAERADVLAHHPAWENYKIDGAKFVENNIAIQAIAAKEPIILEAAKEEFEEWKRQFSKLEAMGKMELVIEGEEENPKKAALNASRKKYKKLFEAVFALADINEGALRIDSYAEHYADWQRKCADFDARMKFSMRDQARDISADILGLQGKNMRPHTLGDWLVKNDAYVLGEPITHALIDDYMRSDDYARWREAYFSEKPQRLYMGDRPGSSFKDTERLSAEQVRALLDYGHKDINDETIIPEISAFARSHKKDLEQLETILAETKIADEKAQANSENRPGAAPANRQGTQAEWFAAAKSHSRAAFTS